MGAMPNSSEYLKWESGQMKPGEEVDFFQRLIDTGELDSLSPRYQTRAKTLIDNEVVFNA